MVRGMVVASRNVSFATVNGVASVMADGRPVEVSGERTRELLHRVTVLERPLERFIFIPGRCNDPFAQMAEAVWVMAGHDDVAWLSRYLPRAGSFSDDGVTWRGAYGPRLRRWRGRVDQFKEVRRVLSEDPSSRRAVMSIFDPENDFAPSRDVPCNNWLHWLVRDGALRLAVAVRSNDAIWGFSGVNAFEWSLLQEAIAHWLGVMAGPQTWLAGSYHVYERHWDRASRMVERFPGVTPYDFGVTRAAFRPAWADFDRALGGWFEAEDAIRADPDAPILAGPHLDDSFLSACLGALRVRWGATAWNGPKLAAELAELPPNDVTAASWDALAREHPALLLDPPEWLACYLRTRDAGVVTTGARLGQALKRLHVRKDRAYGAAWKWRGEAVSVLPNIARKVDRLDVYLREGARGGDESLLDTALDLYVYATKYRLLLEERGPSSGLLPADAPVPFSDHPVNFDRLVDQEVFEEGPTDAGAAMQKAVDTFDGLWRLAGDHGNLHDIRRLVDGLRVVARLIICAIMGRDARAIREFVVAASAHPIVEEKELGAGGPRQAP